jgi:hypothetical protein
MDKDDIQLILLALSTLGTFAIVYLNLPNQAISLPSIPPLVQQIVGGVIASVIAAVLLKGAFRFYNSIGSSGLMEGVITDAALQDLDAIEGCIENEGVAWKGTAHLHRGRVESTDVPFDPLCPKCQTGFIDTTDEPSLQDKRRNPSYSPEAQPTPVFECPNCGHTVDRDSEQYDAVKRLFERHAKQIVESTDEEYSLRTLAENIDGPVTPRSVWEEYAEVVDDEQVSTNCFH